MTYRRVILLLSPLRNLLLHNNHSTNTQTLQVLPLGLPIFPLLQQPQRRILLRPQFHDMFSRLRQPHSKVCPLCLTHQQILLRLHRKFELLLLTHSKSVPFRPIHQLEQRRVQPRFPTLQQILLRLRLHHGKLNLLLLLHNKGTPLLPFHQSQLRHMLKLKAARLSLHSKHSRCPCTQASSKVQCNILMQIKFDLCNLLLLSKAKALRLIIYSTMPSNSNSLHMGNQWLVSLKDHRLVHLLKARL